MTRIWYILFFITFFFWAEAQKTEELLIRSRVVEGEIYLRWGASDVELMKQGQEEGFRITKITAKGASQDVEVMQFKMSDPATWETEGDEQVEIVKRAYAQIRGDNSEYNLVDQLNIQNNVYDLTLYMSDISEKAARLTATGYVDTNVDDKAEYIYRIDIPSVPSVGVSSTRISLSDEYALPIVKEIESDGGNLSARLSWIYKDLRDTFSSYRILKSSDGGKTYQPTSSAPFLPLINYDLEDPEYLASFKDELQENNKSYFYKVAGIDFFGQLSDFSEPMEVIGRPPPIQVWAQFNEIFELDNSAWELTWHLTKEWEQKVKGFYVLRSVDGKKTYQKISELLAPSQRAFTDNSPAEISFYKIVTIDENDHVLESPAGMAQKRDNTPPAAPQWGKGYIDSLGYVYLEWEENEEGDLGGYHVFFGNSPDAEFSKLTNAAELEVNKYIDTIAVKVLADHIYYKLQAIDFRGNQSEFSEVIKLKRPDFLPPTPPVFKRVVQEIDKNQINYTSSSSYDAVATYLLRSKDKLEWEVVDSTSLLGETVQFFDTTAICTQSYFYSMYSEDDAGLTTPSDTISLTCIDSGKRPPIQDFQVELNKDSKQVELNWDYDFYTDVKSVMIYRTDEAGKLRKLKQLWKKDINAESIRSYVDKEIKEKESYEYKVIIRFEDNGFTSTRLSDTVKLSKR